MRPSRNTMEARGKRQCYLSVSSIGGGEGNDAGEEAWMDSFVVAERYRIPLLVDLVSSRLCPRCSVPALLRCKQAQRIAGLLLSFVCRPFCLFQVC